MTYPIIPARRMAWDIDGTEAAIGSVTTGISGWLNETQKFNLNGVDWGTHVESRVFWFFFPEEREVEYIYGYSLGSSRFGPITAIYGSNDTNNGLDGTWEQAVMSSGYPGYTNDFSWRAEIKPVSLSSPVKVLRVHGPGSALGPHTRLIHIYGSKAATETPDDILFMEDASNPYTALLDWGNRPEGTVEKRSFRLKNDSADKTANNINIQLNADDFLVSWDEEGPWTSFLDIASLSPGAVSSPIYVKNELPPPLLILGPRAYRVIVGVGYWS